MSFALCDRVRIRGKNITGEIIDVYRGENDGVTYYTVESDEPEDAQGEWPLYDCTEEQIEKI